MVENGTELIMKGFQIHRGVRFSLGIPVVDHLILPVDNVFWRYLADLPLLEIG